MHNVVAYTNINCTPFPPYILRFVYLQTGYRSGHWYSTFVLQFLTWWLFQRNIDCTCAVIKSRIYSKLIYCAPNPLISMIQQKLNDEHVINFCVLWEVSIWHSNTDGVREFFQETQRNIRIIDHKQSHKCVCSKLHLYLNV